MKPETLFGLVSENSTEIDSVHDASKQDAMITRRARTVPLSASSDAEDKAPYHQETRNTVAAVLILRPGDQTLRACTNHKNDAYACRSTNRFMAATPANKNKNNNNKNDNKCTAYYYSKSK